MEKTPELLKKRLLELANRSYEHNIYTYSAFLDMYEQNIFYTMLPQISHVAYSLTGGHSMPDRVIAVFGSAESLGYEEDLPITCIKAVPLAPRYADELSHRDFLGALMNLGIERSLLGDILVQDNIGYLFCLSHMEGMIIEQLTRVKHTNIKCSVCESNLMIETRYQELDGFVTSCRLDAVIGLAYQLSRSQSIPYIQAQKVFVNSKLVSSNGHPLKDGDIISVRGLGKFVYEGVNGESRKGKKHIIIKKFV